MERPASDGLVMHTCGVHANPEMPVEGTVARSGAIFCLTLRLSPKLLHARTLARVRSSSYAKDESALSNCGQVYAPWPAYEVS